MIKRRFGLLLQTMLLLCGLWMVCCPARALAQDAIVNADVAERAVSQNNLRAIFSMRMRQWPDGTPIKVFVLPGESEVHISFAKSVLNIFPYQLRRAWDLLIYSGSGQAPTEVGSPEEMLQKVASTPGAIGYVSDDYLSKGDKNERVRILEIR